MKSLAKRLDTLQGRTIVWVWDYVFRGDAVFEQLEESLRSRFPGVKFVHWSEFGKTHRADERRIVVEMARKLTTLGVDAVVSGMGCWRSCTPAVLRASAAAEAVGIPSSTLVCESFMALAKAASIGLGMPNLQVAGVPGHPGPQSNDVLQRNVREVTLAGVIDNLLKLPPQVAAGAEPGARDIICRGTFQEVNDYFIANELSDGLPIVPPTVEKVEAFLRHK